MPSFFCKSASSNRCFAALATFSLFGFPVCAQLAPHPSAEAAQISQPTEIGGSESGQFECGSRPPQFWVDEVRAAVARGEIPDPATRVIPPILRRRPRTPSDLTPCLSPAHIYTYEDTDQVLLTDFSIGQLIDLMTDAANELLATHGDNFDFVGYWLNFAPHHVYGTAAYIGLENDATGIGVQSAIGTELFNRRADVGVGGDNIEGFLICWNINWPQWQPGTAPDAFLTRVALNHELEHRFAMFLPDLLDGRKMQGYGGFGCYGPGHPNPAVDTQGSVLGIGEWVGVNPAIVQATYPDFYLFNSDTGGAFSYTELYLMGYVSPAEMDAGNSELRYIENWDCVSTEHYGAISTFTSADIIASAGPRVPDSTAEDHHYRTAWIMLHLPGDPPNLGQKAKAVAINEQLAIDWNFSTLGRGTMNSSLFDDCNCNDVPDADDISLGASPDVNSNGIPDECESLCPADVTTQGAGLGDPGFGVPDGLVTGADINFYVNAWVAQDLAIADVTTQGAGSGDPLFGIPDGIITAADINYYVNLWVAGCP